MIIVSEKEKKRRGSRRSQKEMKWKRRNIARTLVVNVVIESLESARERVNNVEGSGVIRDSDLNRHHNYRGKREEREGRKGGGRRSGEERKRYQSRHC